jgi:bifunctional UDP-N-acetylglucosamine pyrophosphorylase / glucosamine-1-phosphate N-acetyltransferase
MLSLKKLLAPLGNQKLMSLHIVILAAGKGKRMYSGIPKVLHKLAGKSMLERVSETAQQLNPEAIHVIYGHGGEQLRTALPQLAINWILQAEPLGTGHAIKQALCHIPSTSQVLVLLADVPLIQPKTLRTLLEHGKTTASLTLLLATLEDPTGLGRIIRNESGEIHAIIEEKDATAREKQIKEIFSGICCAQAADLMRWVKTLTNNNAQGEYYLTEIIGAASAEQSPIASLQAEDISEIQGVNDRQQLEKLERLCQEKIAQQLMLTGVTLADRKRIDVRGELNCGQDVFIDVNVVFSGKVTLGDNCKIGPNCTLHNVTAGANCQIFANSVLEESSLGDDCLIGPFARLRPGTKLATHCKIGNFVETKNAVLNPGTKAPHLSYLGDVTIGRNVNIGAGTITCNYDGANKNHTIIEDGAFIGSDTQLVAPVTVGANATIGAGSTIRQNAPPGELTLTVSEQKTIVGWKRKEKKEANKG